MLAELRIVADEVGAGADFDEAEEAAGSDCVVAEDGDEALTGAEGV